MPIRYNPEQAATCWPEGDYEAVLERVVDTTSKSSGAEMQVWTIRLYNSIGGEWLVTEYVTAAAAFKIRQLAQAVGRKSEFEAGTFQAENHIGARFIAYVVVEEQDGFDDQNKVKKYKPMTGVPSSLPPAKAGAPPQRQTAPSVSQELRGRAKANVPVTSPISESEEFKDDDIPF